MMRCVPWSVGSAAARPKTALGIAAEIAAVAVAAAVAVVARAVRRQTRSMDCRHDARGQHFDFETGKKRKQRIYGLWTARKVRLGIGLAKTD